MVSTIATKTGPNQHDGSTCRAVLEICDSRGHCCQTSADGRGLFPGQNREIGQTDVYTNASILGNCTQEVRNLHFDPNARLPESQIFSLYSYSGPQNRYILRYIFSLCVQGILVQGILVATLTTSDPDGDDGDFYSNITM